MPPQQRTINLIITGPCAADSNETPHDILADTNVFLANIRQHISRLQSEEQQAIRIIDEQRRIVRERCKIGRLHDDILFYTFNLVVQDYGIGNQQGTRQNLWALAGVCKRWRKVCLEHPRLWRHISLEHSDGRILCTTTTYEPAMLLRTILQLERSQEVPLVVDAQKICDCSSQASRFRAVAAHCHRWESVYFWSFSMKRGQGGVKFTRGLFPKDAQFTQLRRLKWLRSPFSPVWQLSLPFPGGSSLPHLTSVSIQGVMEDVTSRTNLPWHQLTDLSLEYCGDTEDLIATLSHSQRLAHLELSIHSPDSDQPTTPSQTSILTLPLVTEFKYETSSGSSQQMLQSLSFPNLRLAAFRCSHSHATLDAPIKLISRSSCSASLMSLRLKLDCTPDDTRGVGLVPLLQLCPLLENLILEDFCGDSEGGMVNVMANDFLQDLALSRDSSRSSICPRLKDFQLIRVKADPAILMQMVDSRMHASGDNGVGELGLTRLCWTIPQLSQSDEEAEQAIEFITTVLNERYSATNLSLDISLD